jgi:hypothetical protein
MLRPMRTIALLFARVALVTLACAACSSRPKSTTTPSGRSDEPFDLSDEEPHMVVPTTSQTTESLQRVKAAADQGNVSAAWGYVHYLIDLFDWARVTKDTTAKSALAQALGLEDGSGRGFTDQVLDALLVRIDAILTIDRLHAGALSAKTLLQSDRAPPKQRKELFDHMAELKSVSRGNGPVSANATLRLIAFCERAFRDAAQAPTPYRPGILAYCLYPLFDSDPEPYFDEDPSRRPPEPAWQDLVHRMTELARQMDASATRIKALGTRLVAENSKFIGEHKGLMPTRRDPKELGVPSVPRAVPYEWTPIVHLGDGSKIAADLKERIAKVLEQDKRDRVALAFSSQAPASALYGGAKVAAAAGARAIELVVGFPQALKVPPGDYWYDRLTGGKVERMGVLALALDPLTATDAGKPRDAPRATAWDPARASLQLHLTVGPKAWTLSAPGGTFPAIPTEGGEDPAAALRKLLTQIRDAFPDEDGLFVHADAGATYAAVVQAASAALFDPDGRAVFGALALSHDAPRAKGKDLPARVARRAAVKVTVSPEPLADSARAVRRCVQEAVDRGTKMAAMSLEPAAGGVKVTSGPKDPALRKCVSERLAPIMSEKKVTSARVE